MTFFTLTFSNGAAQQKRKMSWEAPADDTKYTQQLALDVGDILAIRWRPPLATSA